jgi:hypothetical protein
MVLARLHLFQPCAQMAQFGLSDGEQRMNVVAGSRVGLAIGGGSVRRVTGRRDSLNNLRRNLINTA